MIKAGTIIIAVSSISVAAVCSVDDKLLFENPNEPAQAL